MSTKKLERTYEGPDYYLLELADTFTLGLEDDLDDFTAFDSTMDADWLNGFKGAVTIALNEDSDDIVEAVQEEKTSDVKTAMEQGTVMYDDTIYFAKKAFPKNKEVWQEFGMGEKYRKALKSQGRMVDFLEELFRTATKYDDQLIAAGFSALRITAINTACTNLRNLNAGQNLYIKGRPVLSRQRIEKLNTVYGYVNQTRDAATRVYRTNFEMQSKYTFNPPVQEDGFTAQTFYINPTTTLEVTELVYAGERIIQVHNKSSVVVVVGLSLDGSTFTGVPISVAAESNVAVTMADLAPDGTFILLQNNTPTTTAEVRVRWQD